MHISTVVLALKYLSSYKQHPLDVKSGKETVGSYKYEDDDRDNTALFRSYLNFINIF